MSEDSRTKRTDYRASVEAGFRRLESEKLSFLGSSNVISKFDPENIEAYSLPVADDDDDETTLHERISPELLGGIAGDAEGDSHATSRHFDATGARDTSSGVQSVSSIAEVFEHCESDEPAAAKGEGGVYHSAATLNFAAIKNYDTDEAPPTSELPSLDAYGMHGVSNIDNAIPRAAGRAPEDGDAKDDPRRVRTADTGREAEPACEATEKEENRRAAQVLKPGLLPRERQKTRGPAIDRLKEQGLFSPVPVIHHEVNQNLEEIRRPAKAPSAKGVHELDEILPKSDVQAWRAPSAEGAHELDEILPKSDVQTWRGQFDSPNEFGDRTMPQDPDAVNELKHVAMLVKAAHDEKIRNSVNMVPAVSAADMELESRETIPIDVSQVPPEIFSSMPKRKPPRDVRLETSELSESPADEDDEPAHTGLWIAVIAVLVAGIGVMLYLMGAFAGISPLLNPHSSAPVEVTENFDVTFYTPEDMARAVLDASRRVERAADFDAYIGGYLEKMINRQSAPDGMIPYLDAAHALYPQDERYLQRLVEGCIAAGSLEDARRVLKASNADVALAQKLRMKILMADPRFLPEVQTLTEEMCDAIDPLGGGSTLTFRIMQGGEKIGAFKPLQTRRQSNYRAEIAAWRLCEMLECDFSVPWNRPVRIERAQFEKLFARSRSKKKSSYSKELIDIIWTKDEGKAYVYGTLKDWVPEFTRFPIEMTSFWKGWISQSEYIAEYRPIAESLSPLKRNKHTQKLYAEIMKMSPDLTTAQLAAQVSEVLVFDYLIGNWDRFSGVPEWWGVNCQYKDGRIVSIDNGAGFPSYSNDKVAERFMMAERFSAHFIGALRGLDKEQAFKALFPEPSQREAESFEQFWRQRASVLSRVDKLSEQYGADRVLSL